MFFFVFFCFFLFWGMVCTFCLKSGHTIVSCTKEGVEEEREKRKNDPKAKERRRNRTRTNSAQDHITEERAPHTNN